MQIYKAPINDYDFLLKDFLNISSFNSNYFKDIDLNEDDLITIIEEAAKLCEETLLPLNQSGDLQGCSFKDGKVLTPNGFKESYKLFSENGWQGIKVDEKYGGQIYHIL